MGSSFRALHILKTDLFSVSLVPLPFIPLFHLLPSNFPVIYDEEDFYTPCLFHHVLFTF